MIAYTVEPGDSLWQIAQKFGLDLNELVAANPQISDVNQICGGQVLQIPELCTHEHHSRPHSREYKPAPEAVSRQEIPERPCIYTAMGGETLESIGQSHMIPLSRMLYYNLRYSRGEALPEGARVVLPETDILPVSPRTLPRSRCRR